MTERSHRGLCYRQAVPDIDASARVEMITLARATLRPGADAKRLWSMRRPAAKAALGCADAHRRDPALRADGATGAIGRGRGLYAGLELR